jgi:branched-chain amino acid aminotransferase
VTFVSIDGVRVDPQDAKISVFDRGFLYGDGAFEVLRTWNGRAVELPRHLDRLFETLDALSLRADRAVIERAVGEGLVGQPVELAIRIVVTRGPGPLAHRLRDLDTGATIVIVEPIGVQPTTVTAATVVFPLARRSGRGHKTLAYLDHVIARELARDVGADEAIRLDSDGSVVEAATSNVFAVVGGTVVTPPVDTGALPGIVRRRVLQLHPVTVRPLSMRELVDAEELFLTSSIKGVIGVHRLDNAPRGVGPVTTRIADAYVACMRDPSTI